MCSCQINSNKHGNFGRFWLRTTQIPVIRIYSMEHRNNKETRCIWAAWCFPPTSMGTGWSLGFPTIKTDLARWLLLARSLLLQSWRARGSLGRASKDIEDLGKKVGRGVGGVRTRHVLSLRQLLTEFRPQNMQAWTPCSVHLVWRNWFYPDSIILFLAASLQRRNKFQRVTSQLSDKV